MQQTPLAQFFKRQPNDPRLTVFVWAFSCAVFCHFLYMLPDRIDLHLFQNIRYLWTINPLALLNGVLAAVLLISPRLYYVFALMLLNTVPMLWAYFPSMSNHAMILFTICLACSAIFLAHLPGFSRMPARERWSLFYKQIAPVGRWVLLLMYFYGIFHKINLDFLNPAASCAVALWEKTPFLPAPLAQSHILHLLAIYGTFAIEFFCIAALLGPAKYRHFGIIAGILFHSFIGINLFAWYGPFTMLSIAMHTLFLQPVTARRITTLVRLAFAKMAGASPLTAWIAAIFFLALVDQHLTGVHVWRALQTGVSVALLGLIILARKPSPAPAMAGWTLLRTEGVLAPIFIALFFINGMLPYLGGKTAQSLNMFSNLRTERGETNHLIMPPSLLGVLPYQQKTYKVLEAKDSSYFEAIKAKGDSIIAAFLPTALRHDNKATLLLQDESNNQTLRISPDSPLPDELKKPPLPLYKFMVFTIVRNERPVSCYRN